SDVGHNAPQARHRRTLFVSALQRTQISLTKTPPGYPSEHVLLPRKFAGGLIPAQRVQASRPQAPTTMADLFSPPPAPSDATYRPFSYIARASQARGSSELLPRSAAPSSRDSSDVPNHSKSDIGSAVIQSFWVICRPTIAMGNFVPTVSRNGRLVIVR